MKKRRKKKHAAAAAASPRHKTEGCFYQLFEKMVDTLRCTKRIYLNPTLTQSQSKQPYTWPRANQAKSRMSGNSLDVKRTSRTEAAPRRKPKSKRRFPLRELEALNVSAVRATSTSPLQKSDAYRSSAPARVLGVGGGVGGVPW